MNIMTLRGGRDGGRGIAMPAAVLLLGLQLGTVSGGGTAIGAAAPAGVERQAIPMSIPGRCTAVAGGDVAGYYLATLSGDRQSGKAGGLLAEPIVARLIDQAGNGIAGRQITFAVRRGCERLVDVRGMESQHLVLHTDARGDAAAALRLGSCSETRIGLVCAYAAGAQTPARFIVSAVAPTAADTNTHPGKANPKTTTEEE